MKEAAELAESTQILLNVSEFTDVSAATDSLISTVQAFKYTAEESMSVVDILNTIGNNYAISTADLAQSLTKSSSALVAANGTLEEAVALTAAANTTIQDADVVGTALKTISMRLRGTSISEMEEDGLETEGYTTQSKLRDTVKSVTGINLTDTGAYKSTYQILAEIAEVWNDITDDQAKAGLLEALAGKRSGSVVAAILQNPDVLKDAFESAKGAQGSAQAELEKYMDSIQGRIDQFNNALQSMWNNVLDDDLVKFIVQAGTELLKFIDNLGVVKTLVIGIGTFLIQKNFKGDLWGGLFNAQSIDEAKDRLKTLQAEIKALQGQEPSKRNDRKINRKQKQADILGASLDKYDELSKQLTKNRIDADAAKKALDEYNESLAKKYAQKKNKGKSPTDEEIAKQQELQRAYNGANDEIVKTEADLKKVEVQAKATGTAGLGAGNKIATGFKRAIKSIGQFAGQLIVSMAHIAAITAAMELVAKAGEAVWNFFGDNNKSVEKLKERFDNLNAELESAESEVEKLTSELDATNEALAELLAKDAPSFVEKEELERLQTQSAELERQVKLAKELRDNLQASVNEAAINATGAYLNETSFASETSKSERVEKSGSTVGAIGTVAGYALGTTALKALATTGAKALGTLVATKTAQTGFAAAGAKIGTALGSAAPGIGNVIGLAVGTVAGHLIGKLIGETIGGKKYEKEKTVQEAINDMPEDRAELKKARDEAYEKYSKNPENEKLKTAWNEASENLATYDQNMAKHISQIQEAYNAIEITQDTDASTKAYKQQLGDIIDQYNMAMGGEGAKEVAINRVFDDGGFEDAKKAIDYYVQALADGDKSAAGAIEEIINDSEELKEAFSAKNLKIEDAIKYFTQIGEAANFDTIEGKTEEIKRATEKLPEVLNNIGKFMDGDVVDKIAIADEFKGTSDKTREEIAKLVQDINDGKIDVDNALKKFELFGVQSVVEIEISEVQTNFKDAFTDLENADGLINTFQELADAIGSTSKAMDALNAAQAEMDYSGRVSIETALKLMESTDDYSKVLAISEGKLVLAEDAEENLIDARLEGMKASALKALEEAKAARETTVLARETAITALSTYDSAVETEMAAAVTATAWDKVLAAAAGLWAGIKSLFTDESWTEAYDRAYQETLNSIGGDKVAEVEAKYSSAEEQARRAGLEKTVEDANKAIEEQDKEIEKLQGNYDLISGLNKDNIGNVFKSDDLKDPEDAEKKKQDDIKDGWEALLSKYENQLALLSNERDLIQAEIDKAEVRGGQASKEMYDDLIRLELEEKQLLEEKKTELEEYLRVHGDSIDPETWTDYNNEINATAVAIEECTSNIYNFAQALREIDMHYFEQATNEISRLAEEIDFVMSLFEDEDMSDESGNWTEAGITKINLMRDQMTAYAGLAKMWSDRLTELQGMEKGTNGLYAFDEDTKNAIADDFKSMFDAGLIDQATYDEYMKQLNEAWSAGGFSEEIYNEWVNEAEDGMRDAISAQKDVRDAMLDMWDEYIDKIEEGIEKEIEAYEDLIDAQKEELDAARELHDFRKQVANDSKDISELERRIASLSGSTAASDVAERRKLQAQLRDKQGELDDRYYDHAHDARSNALDDEANAFAEAKNRYVENMREAAKDTEWVINEMITNGIFNADVANDFLLRIQETYNIPLSTELTAPWAAAADRAEEFKNAVGIIAGEGIPPYVTMISDDIRNKLATNDENNPWNQAVTMAAKYADFLTDNEFSLDNKDMTTFEGQINSIIGKWNDVKTAADNAYNAQNRTYNVGGNPNVGNEQAGDDNTEDTPNFDTDTKGDKPVETPPQKAPAPTRPASPTRPKFKKVGDLWSGVGHTGVSIGKKSYNKALEIEGGDGIYYPFTNGSGYKGYIKKGEGYTVLSNGKMDVHTFKPIYQKYAKGTTGTTRDGFALTDEPQFGDELVLVPGKDGNLSFMRKGTGVVPADMTQKLFELAQIPTSDLMNKNLTAIVPNITKNDFKNEFNFESLVHVDTVDSDTLPKLEKMVDKKIDDFSRALNYSLKKFSR